jgi:hypothetical protein
MTTIRHLLLAAVALATPDAARCGAPAPPLSTFQKFAMSDVVVTGKVTSIEKDTVAATSPYAGAKDKVAYTVAVVKIDADLGGANNLTHVRVGFVPPDPNAKPIRGSGGVIRTPEPVPVLKQGDQMALFLVKHPTADFYVMPYRNMPLDLSGEAGKKELEVVKRFAAALADPMKGLKSDKAEVRGETAAFLLMKYRSYPALGGETEQVAIPAEESKLILKGLAEADWSFRSERTAFSYAPLPYLAFRHLGLREKDGWIDPVVAVVPGQPAPDYGEVHKDAFGKWLAGPGKDYQIKKLVPKKQ